VSCHFPDSRRDGNPDRLENLATGTEAFTPDGKRFAPVFNRDLLQGLEILLDVSPFETVTGLLQPAVQFLAEDQGQKTAKDMTPDGLIPLMEDGPGVQNRLHVPEDLLDLPELLVREGRLLRRQRGVCFEHPLPVVPRLFFDLRLIDGNGILLHVQVLPIALVSYKGYRIGFKLLLEGIDDRLPVRRVLAGLFFIQTDDVAAAIHHHFLDLQGGRIFGGDTLRMNLPVTAGTGEYGRRESYQGRRSLAEYFDIRGNPRDNQLCSCGNLRSHAENTVY
jgi:hypothetical protein